MEQDVNDNELEKRLAAIENNVNANTSMLMALSAALEALPGAEGIDPQKAAGLFRASASTQPALAARLQDAVDCLTTILGNARMNAGR